MHQLQMATRRIGGVEVLKLTGMVEPASFDTLANALTRLLAENEACIILDCQGVTYISSIELKELLDFPRYARARGGDIKCVGLAPTIQQVATLVANGDPMDCFEDVTSAIAQFHVNVVVTSN
jgi:anti-sigma B factor antagonist